jgi:lysophospholipase L1-like esterase
MKITVGKVRLAWVMLVILAAISYPATYVGPISVAGLLLAFLPGGVVLWTARGSARVIEGLRYLMNQPSGRLSLGGAFVLATLVGLTFNPFVAFALTGLFCGLVWSLDVLFGATAWEKGLVGWSVAGLSGFLTLAAVDAVLNWGPVARRLGTPSEVAAWGRDRYDVGPPRDYDPRTPNFFGFRSPYEDTRRRPGVRRVIALGDSFTWGSKIRSSDSTWPALLEHLLTQPPEGAPTEVVNMGHSGFSTGNEAELLRRIGWQFHPDLVIVQWLNNDPHVSLPNFGAEPHGAEDVRLVPPQYRTGWIRNSGILALLERVLTSRFLNVLDIGRKEFAPNARGWLFEQERFREMGDSAARNCTPILLVLYPYLFPGRWTMATYPQKEIHGMVAAAARSARLEVLDLLPTFLTAGKDLKDWWGTAYDSHPGGAAQLLAARAIAGYIQDHRLLADSTTGEPGIEASSCPRSSSPTTP